MTAEYYSTPKKFARGGNCVLEATWQIRCDLNTVAIERAFIRSGNYKNGGVYNRAWIEVFMKLGIRYRRVNTFQYMSARYMTVSQFAEANPVGVFFITIKGHALAVINGRVVDPNFTANGGKPKLRARVDNALMITNPVTNYTGENKSKKVL